MNILILLVLKEKKKIEYITSEKHIESYENPEEKVRAKFFAELIYKYEYPANRIKIEVVVPDRLPTDRADIVVFSDNDLYDEIHEHIPKKVFLARWYPSAEDDGADEFRKAESRISAIKEIVKQLNLELTDLGTRETGTFDIRDVMYHDIRECDIFIADLSGARHNVMIKVGYALKHVETARMLFYFQTSDKCKSVPFDVSHLNYVPIVDSAEIKTSVKTRIENILEQARNGEI